MTLGPWRWTFQVACRRASHRRTIPRVSISVSVSVSGWSRHIIYVLAGPGAAPLVTSLLRFFAVHDKARSIYFFEIRFVSLLPCCVHVFFHLFSITLKIHQIYTNSAEQYTFKREGSLLRINHPHHVPKNWLSIERR